MPAPGLVEQLQAGATEGGTPLGDLLRKTKLAATKLKVKDMETWADSELNGYALLSSLPEYRNVVGEIKALNPFHGWIPVSGIGPVFRECRQSISHIERIIESSHGPAIVSLSEEDSETLRQSTGLKFQFKILVPIPLFVSLLDTVRNKILDWTIDLESRGVYGEGLSFSRDEVNSAQSSWTQNIFNGPVAGFAQHQSTIERVEQNNTSSTSEEIMGLISSLIHSVQEARSEDAGAAGAVVVLSGVKDDVQHGKNPPLARVKAALELLRTSEDIALKAPGIMHQLHQVGVAFGIL